MRHVRHSLAAAALLVAGTSATLDAQYVYGVTTTARGTQQLVRFNAATPGSVTAVGPTGANLIGLDVRPATGMLYGYDGTAIYTVDPATGAASFAFDVGDVTGNPGFDFNPTVDRIRVVGPSGANLRLNPNTGGTTTDMPYTYASGDAAFGQTPVFNAVAYTNSDNDPTTGTALFGIDANLGTLVRLTNPNGGTINTVGGLGVTIMGAVTGFDIFTVGGTNVGFFSTAVTGTMPMSSLYSIDLTTGGATMVGTIGVNGTIDGIALAAVPEPSTWALMGTGLVVLGAVGRRRRLAA